MVKIKFTCEDGTLRLKMKGHAGMDKAGRDLLCASTSMLAITLASVIQKSEADGLLEEKPEVILKEGFTVVKAKPKPDSFAEVLHSYYVIEQGFAFLSQYQPEHIQLTVFDVSVKDCQ